MTEKTEHYSADKPISSQKQDRFQRFEFSRRIAQTIKQRESDESIVFGLFGAWGEGKSSVINFIDSELKLDGSIITLHLNPWRYTDEESLLFNFFERIAKALDKELNSKKEKVSSFIEKYGGISKIFGIDNTDISKAIADTKLEDFKERVDGFLTESAQRMVIFIDDIDRLDKQEISTLFRLIKLTADFSKTIYILSFDESMVASSIGERFGSGDYKAGENFLEKIIQVPLTIPKAQPEALQKFCFDLLNKALDTNKIDLTKEEASRFVYQFSNNILSRLDTPRLAVRYSNTISFSLPLLHGEVNAVDLMLIEALKVFYHDHYKFVKDYPDLFLGSYNSGSVYGGRKTDASKIDFLKTKLEELGQSLKKRQKGDVEDLLTKMFPRLEGALNNLHYDRGYSESWKKEKRICSSAYFDRYFSYSVIDGDISDVQFEQFIHGLSISDCEQVISGINELSEKSSLLKFIEKLHSHAQEIEWEDFKILGIAISKLSDKLELKGSPFNLHLDSSLKQAIIFIYRHLEKNRLQSDLFTVANKFIEESTNIDFLIELLTWYEKGETLEEKIFTSQNYKTFKKTMVDQILSTLENGENLLKKYPEQYQEFLRIWFSINKKMVKQNVDNILNENKNNVILLLRAFSPLIYSTAYPEPYKGDLSYKSFLEITNYINPKKIEGLIFKIYSKEEIEKEEVIMEDRRNGENQELNLIRQFISHLTQKNSNKKPK